MYNFGVFPFVFAGFAELLTSQFLTTNKAMLIDGLRCVFLDKKEDLSLSVICCEDTLDLPNRKQEEMSAGYLSHHIEDVVVSLLSAGNKTLTFLARRYWILCSWHWFSFLILNELACFAAAKPNVYSLWNFQKISMGFE